MTGGTIGAAALALGLLLGTLLVPGMPFFALPVAAVLIAVLGGLELRRRTREARTAESLREDAAADSIDFTDRDRQTLAD